MPALLVPMRHIGTSAGFPIGAILLIGFLVWLMFIRPQRRR
jgi:hypothetical protein